MGTVNQLFQWQFSIAICLFFRGYISKFCPLSFGFWDTSTILAGLCVSQGGPQKMAANRSCELLVVNSGVPLCNILFHHPLLGSRSVIVRKHSPTRKRGSWLFGRSEMLAKSTTAEVKALKVLGESGMESSRVWNSCRFRDRFLWKIPYPLFKSAHHHFVHWKVVFTWGIHVLKWKCSQMLWNTWVSKTFLHCCLCLDVHHSQNTVYDGIHAWGPGATFDHGTKKNDIPCYMKYGSSMFMYKLKASPGKVRLLEVLKKPVIGVGFFGST
jgi:hypothetical protein